MTIQSCAVNVRREIALTRNRSGHNRATTKLTQTHALLHPEFCEFFASATQHGIHLFCVTLEKICSVFLLICNPVRDTICEFLHQIVYLKTLIF